MGAIDSEREAKELAAQIVADIALYNRVKVKSGIENDNLFDMLGEEIERGREFFRRSVSEGIYNKTNAYNEALADILVKSNSGIVSRLW